MSLKIKNALISVSDKENISSLLRIFKKYNIKPTKYMETCSLPTDENPFMNPLVTDRRTRKGACKTFNNKKITSGIINCNNI